MKERKHDGVNLSSFKAALARWVGSFLSLAFVWALLSNHFAVHTSKFAPLLNGTYFLSEFILYYANEKAFFRD